VGQVTSSALDQPFSFSTITDFDRHIDREIRGYDLLFSMVTGLADSIIEGGSTVYDIGCSTGRLINMLATAFAAERDEARQRDVTFVGYEPNWNFAQGFVPATHAVRFRHEPVTVDTRFPGASLITSLFTLQFTSVRDRPRILRNVYRGLHAGGALILAEKVYAGDAAIERLINDRHIDFKSEGSSAEAILSKDRRLRAIMRPLTLDANYRMLQKAGFTRYESFWRVNNFVAVLAVKS
jgi:tRNA (cmo5U34)-methyltransferase